MTHAADIKTTWQTISRRQMLRTGTLGTATVAASTVMAAQPLIAQSGPASKELACKTTFVTGGARGIGLASAIELARAGANIVLYDIAARNVPTVQFPLASADDLADANWSAPTAKTLS